MRAGAEHDPRYIFGAGRGDLAALALLTAAIKHQPGFVRQACIWPVINPTGLRYHDLAPFILTGNPVGVFRRQVTLSRVEHLQDRKPGTPARLLPDYIQQFIEIVAQPEPQADFPPVFVALDNKFGDQPGRPMDDRQRVRKAQIVGRNDIGIDAGPCRRVGGGDLVPVADIAARIGYGDPRR